jgi:hypothetical protein
MHPGSSILPSMRNNCLRYNTHLQLLLLLPPLLLLLLQTLHERTMATVAIQHSNEISDFNELMSGRKVGMSVRLSVRSFERKKRVSLNVRAAVGSVELRVITGTSY